jgi:hypothetical protein
MRALTFRPGLNVKTVNNCVTVLRRALDMAVADHALEDNLVGHVRYQWQQTPFPDPFTGDEVETIIEYMTERYPDGVANYVEFKFFSGLPHRKPQRCAGPMWIWSATESMCIAPSYVGPKRTRPRPALHATCC